MIVLLSTSTGPFLLVSAVLVLTVLTTLLACYLFL
jgi:hypothetical protein